MKRDSGRIILVIYFLFDQLLCRFLLFPLLNENMSADAYHSLAVVVRLTLLTVITLLWLPHLMNEISALKKSFPKGLLYMGVTVICLIIVQSGASLFLRHFGNIPFNQTYTDVLQKQNLFRSLFEGLFYAPVIEEIVFHDVLIERFREKKTAVWLSCALFGLTHALVSLVTGNVQEMPYVFVYALCGYILFFSKEKSGSLVCAMGAHAMINLLAVLV